MGSCFQPNEYVELVTMHVTKVDQRMATYDDVCIFAPRCVIGCGIDLMEWLHRPRLTLHSDLGKAQWNIHFSTFKIVILTGSQSLC
jgi:hypothetical protein